MRDVKNGYKVASMSNDDIQSSALILRKLLNVEDVEYINIIGILEFLSASEDIPLNYYICEDCEVQQQGEGFYNPETKTIIIPNSVYGLACNGDGRARFTVGHEMGHWWLNHSVTFARGAPPNKLYQNSEWQADKFSSCFIAPPHMVSRYRSASDVSFEFGLSEEAATYALKNAKKVRLHT